MNYKVISKIIDGKITLWAYDLVPIRCTGLNDTTVNEMLDYDERCSMCKLGYSHSGDYHRQELAEYSSRNK